MKRLRKFAMIFAFLILGMSGCFVTAFPQWDVRYRLTLEVEADGILYRGANVGEAGYMDRPANLSEIQNVSIGQRGEALGVDIGARGTLFLLLTEDRNRSKESEDPSHLLLNFVSGKSEKTFSERAAALKPALGIVEIPPRRLPLLVHFRDINDPRSVERVNPENLATTLGPGVKLVRATGEILSGNRWPLSYIIGSRESLTTGIEKRLSFWNGPFPYLKDLGNGVFEDTRTESLKFSKRDFKQGSP